MLTKMPQNAPTFFTCISCDFKSSKKSHYERHLTTHKHKMLTNVDKVPQKGATPEFICECGKTYKHRQSLSIHKKKCLFIEESTILVESKKTNLENNNLEKNNSEKNKQNTNLEKINNKVNENETTDYKSIIMKLIDENAEFKNLLIKQQDQIGELIPKVGNNNTNIKQKFNINIFLNEQCKDALNMNDFLNQIEISLENLLTTKNKGLTEGISNVFIENMSKLSLYERPMHCTDIKRETLYIKENNVWEKDQDKSRIKTAIKEASCAQFKRVKEWMDENPDYENDEKKQQEFIQLIVKCGESIDGIDSKIIKRLCNSSYLKDNLDD